ncbi:MAG: acetyl-CoA carboxylase biotin carboxyl carrier protein [Cyclobacteriaceae bacterium]
MNIKDVKSLLDHIVKSGLQEVNIETEEIKLSTKRTGDVVTATAPALSAAPLPIAAPAAIPVAAAPAEAAAPAAKPAASGTEVKSPMIGTFYRSANPETPVYVEIGSKVKKGDTLCIIEAMKLFNEIESEVSGTIIDILVDDSTQ